MDSSRSIYRQSSGALECRKFLLLVMVGNTYLFFVDGFEVGVQSFPIDDSRASLERIDQCSTCYGFHPPWEEHWSEQEARDAGGRI